MSKCVIVREDEPDLADLVRELLEEAGYTVVHVISVDDLLDQARKRAPCVALVDGMSPSAFDLWWLGPVLVQLGVPPVVFTAHASAHQEFAADPRGYIAVIGKPFDADEFVEIVNSICWTDTQAAAS